MSEKSKKRGPRGLASSRNKKTKIDKAPEAIEDSSTPVSLDTESKTVAIPDDIDDEDETGQLVALYGTAIEALEKRDIKAALPIINGTVHEADRILRNKPEDITIAYDLHWVYASALLDLSLLIDDSTAKSGDTAGDFVAAAQERCQFGLSNGAGHGLSQLRLTQARYLARDVQCRLQSTSTDLDEITTIIEKIMAQVDDTFKPQYYTPLQVAQIVNVVQDFGDSLLEENAELHDRLNKWAEKIWTKVLTYDQENVSALEDCGRVWLSLAQPALSAIERLEEDQEDQEESEKSQDQLVQLTETARDMLQTSVELLTQALKCAEKRGMVTGDLLCLLAEATISLANTFDEGSHYTELEKTTSNYLKRAKDIPEFELPERFQDMLKDDNSD